MSKPGFLLPSELTRVQGDLYLANAAAVSFVAMRDAAAADGVSVTIVPPGGGYRTMAFTLAMRADPAKYNVTPGVVPSLYSKHMLGVAADIGSGFAWVKEHGGKFGWSFPLKHDPNHSVYDGTVVAGSGTRISEEEDLMAKNIVDVSTYKNGKVQAGTVCATVWEGGRVVTYPRTLKAGEAAVSYSAMFGPHVEVSHDVFVQITDYAPASAGVATDLGPVLSAISESQAAVISSMPKTFTAQ